MHLILSFAIPQSKYEVLLSQTFPYKSNGKGVTTLRESATGSGTPPVDGFEEFEGGNFAMTLSTPTLNEPDCPYFDINERSDYHRLYF
ncbi:hypothetical protein OKD05_00020 [Enterobacter cloacae]|nr:hypothetical protein OKD05_00020 [Enterobacter cloacae]